MEHGLLCPGQMLYFEGLEGEPAIVLADGRIRYNSLTGSIHQVAKELKEAPCNGWDHWYYKDDVTGKMQVIDGLRKILQKEIDISYEDVNLEKNGQ